MMRLFLCFSLSIALANNPPEPSELYQSLQRALHNKNLSEAKKLSDQLLKKGPTSLPNPFVYYDISLQIILLEIENGHVKAAHEQISSLELMQLPPAAQTALLFAKARLAAKESGTPAALSQLRAIETSLPFIEWPQSEKLFHHTICHAQNSSCDTLLTKADEAFKNRRFSVALEHFDRLIALVDQGLYPKALKNPRIETHIRFYKGKSLAYLGEHAKAVDQYARIAEGLQSVEEAQQIHFELGVSLFHLEQYLSAKEHFEKVLSESSPSNTFFHRAHLFLAKSALDLNDYTAADKSLHEIEVNKKLCTSHKVLQKASQLSLKLIKKMPHSKWALAHLDFAEEELLKLPQDDRVALKLTEVWALGTCYDRPGTHKIAELLKHHVFTDDEIAAKVRFELIRTLKNVDEMSAHLNVFATPHLIRTDAAIEALIWASERLISEGRIAEAEQYITLAEKEAASPDQKARAASLQQECLKSLYQKSL